MATAGGPDIVNDGLVFGYDTGYGIADNDTATRFYPGKAVDNEFYNSGPDGTILDYVGYGGTGTAQSGALDALGTTDNIVYRKTGKLRFGPTGGDDIGTLYYGNTYTFSIYMRHVSGETQMSGGEFDIVDQSSGGKNYSGTLSSNMTYEWKRFSVTSTHTNSSNYHFIDVGTYQGTGVFEWCCPQIELGTIASPFTSTERSSTASLIDLKRTASIDVSNVSFDSTGQPTFDGTDDAIQLSSSVFNRSGSNPITVECVTKPGRLSGQYQDLVVNRSNSAYNWMLYQHTNDGSIQLHGGGQYKSTYVPVVGNYIHVVATVDASNNMVLYINGEVKQTVSSYAYASGQPGALSIGRFGTSSEPYLGDISVAKIYDTALSATQVAQNYNAYKNRFDI
tara:strand:+ start:40 stop:1218 length:1179 start_codon:yes stop_codon:yes gene_type:complete